MQPLTVSTRLADAFTAFCAIEPDTLTERSWAVYKSSLRTLIGLMKADVALGWLPREDVLAAFVSLESMYQSARIAQSRAAWGRFRDWCKAQGVDVPAGPDRRRRGPRSKVTMPPREVGEAIFALLESVPSRSLTQRGLLKLRWGDVQAEKFDGVNTLVIPANGSHLILPQKAVKAMRELWKYARGENGKATGFVVPAAKGSPLPMSLATLRQVLQTVRQQRKGADATEKPARPVSEAVVDVLSEVEGEAVLVADGSSVVGSQVQVGAGSEVAVVGPLDGPGSVGSIDA